MSDGFLSRWSRRKRGEAEAPPPEEAPPPAPIAEAAPPAVEPEPEFDLSQLPPLETLTAESDFSVFFRPGVPAAIRGAALRKAWVADPLIRDHLSSLDYGWDFNAPASMPGFSLDLGETGERLRRLIAQAVGERGEEEPAAAAPTAAPPDPAAGPVADAPDAMATVALAPAEAPPAPPVKDEPPPRLRRHGGAMPA